MLRAFPKKFLYLFIILFLLFPSIILSYSQYFAGYNDSNTSVEQNLHGSDPDFDLSFLPEIDYASLEHDWYFPKIEMLIIAPNRTDFIDTLKPLMDWKNEKGVKTIILSNFSDYDGRDDPEKIRTMIKSYYEKENIDWVLLAGDAQNDLIPIREVYNPDVVRYGGSEAVGNDEYKPTDYYYADLTGDLGLLCTWDSDEDSNWGEAPQDNLYWYDEISWVPEVYVGRFPADTVEELEIMVNKTLKYETDPYLGDWMNRMLLAGGISDYHIGGSDGEYESWLTSHIIQNFVNLEMNSTHLVEEEGNLTRTELRSQFNNGYSTVLMAGHGSPTTYYRNPTTAGYTSADASSSSNINMPSLVYIDACSTSCYDWTDNNIGETLIKQLSAGAIGFIGGLRVSWYYEDDFKFEKLNRGNAKLFWKEFFEEKKFQPGRALYDSKVSYINSDYYKRGEGSTSYDFERKNLLTYCLLGDPEIDIYTDNPKSASNPFNQNIYAGQLVSVEIRDVSNNIIPYARVHFRTPDGKYYTTYANKEGITNFRVPAQVNETYNVTITGHNLIPSYFNFTTLLDVNNPELSKLVFVPRNPSVSDNICFNIEIHDNQSGIESVYLLISKDQFNSFTSYRLSNSIQEDEKNFEFIIDKLKPGNYSYRVVTRDYANNTNVFYNETYTFQIPKPIMNYMLCISMIIILSVVAISVLFLVNGIKKHSRLLDRIEQLN
ncbi:MAG: C25 family cysteine peptidase [Candidatus Hodarchaeota archaeon]